MTLDNEQQRTLILQIINSVPIYGPYPKAKEAVAQVDELISSVEAADIKAAQ